MKDEPRAIHDPVYGAIYPDELEWQLISSRPVQRLKGIKQLGLIQFLPPALIANVDANIARRSNLHSRLLLPYDRFLSLLPYDLNKSWN